MEKMNSERGGRRMWLVWGLVGVVVLLVAAAGVLYATARDFSKTPDLKTVKMDWRPNQYLICPPDYCADKPHAEAPVYNLTADKLAARLSEALKTEHRLTRLDKAENPFKSAYIQTTPKIGWPDRVDIEIVPLTDTTASLAIYSRSKYGRRDMGVNKARVKRWLKRLDKAVAEE